MADDMKRKRDYGSLPNPKRALLAASAAARQTAADPPATPTTPAAAVKPAIAASGGGGGEAPRDASLTGHGRAAYDVTAEPPTCQEELDVKALQVQNHQLALRVAQRAEEMRSLHARAAEAESRASRSTAAADALNTHWQAFAAEAEAALGGPSLAGDNWAAAFRRAAAEALETCEAQAKAQCSRCTDLVARCLAAASDNAGLDEAAALHRACLNSQGAKDAAARAQEELVALRSKLDETEFRLEKASNSAFRLRDRLAAAEARAKDAIADATAAGAAAALQRTASSGGGGGEGGGGLTPQASQEMEVEL